MVLRYHHLSEEWNISLYTLRLMFVIIRIMNELFDSFFQLLDIDKLITAENLVITVDQYNQQVSLFDVNIGIVLLIFRYRGRQTSCQTVITIIYP